MFSSIQEKCVPGLVKEMVSKVLNDILAERLLKAQCELSDRPP